MSESREGGREGGREGERPGQWELLMHICRAVHVFGPTVGRAAHL